MKIALVTGSGSGIGRAVAVALSREGYSVVLAGRRPEALRDTAASCRRKSSLIVPTDVTDAKSVEALFAKVKSSYRRLDLVFNNAGISPPPVLFEDLTIEQWNEVVGASLTGAFLCAREAFKIMKAQRPQGGRIINNGSLAAHVPRPNSAPYCAAKHGITGLTKATCLDGRKYNIACGQIDIGNADTAMAAKTKRGVLQASGAIAAEPAIAVEHVVDAILYMSRLPLDANVPFLTVMATKMPYIGRG